MSSLSIHTTDIIGVKKYPENYTSDLLEVINLLSYKNTSKLKTEEPIIYGSASIKISSPSDYDCYQKILSKDIQSIIRGFKEIINNLEKKSGLYIADIKCGSIDALKIIPNHVNEDNYNEELNNMIDKANELYRLKKIDKEEYNNTLKYLKPDLRNFDIAIIKKEIRFNIGRWTPEEIKKGYIMRRGYKLTLEEAVQQKELTKIDVISFNVNRYPEISMVYLFSLNGKIINQGYNEEDREILLQQTIPPLIFDDNYFKVAKRIFAIERYRKNSNLRVLEILMRLFNSDLGRLYQICSDLNTTLYMFDNYKNLDMNRIEYMLNQIRFRTSNFINKEYEKHENKLLKLLGQFEYNPKNNVKKLIQYRDEMFNLLNTQTKKYLESNRLLPVPAEYLPFKTESEEQISARKSKSESKLKKENKVIGKGEMTKYKNQYLLEDNDEIIGDGKKFIKMPIKSLVKEHKNLINVLKKGSKVERFAEAEDQYKELQDYLKDYKA